MVHNIGLSVVIPCYNSRNGILRALKSLENSLLRVEVIVIEDCSEFSSEDLIKNYKNNTSLNIKYFKNDTNLGAGRTRNIGIKEATYEYITFLDSDDEFSPLYFSEVILPIMSGYDEIIYNARQVFDESTKELNMFFSKRINEGRINQKDALVYIKGCTCGKIYKTSIIKDNNVEFGSMKRNEDMVFTKVATSYMNSIFYINKPLYIYHNNKNSLMNDSSLITFQNAVDAYSMVEERLTDRCFEKELNSIRFIELLYSTTNSLIYLNRSKDEIKENYISHRKKYNSDDPYRRNYSRIYKISFWLFECRLFGLYSFLRVKLKTILKKDKG